MLLCPSLKGQYDNFFGTRCIISVVKIEMSLFGHCVWSLWLESLNTLLAFRIIVVDNSKYFDSLIKPI